MAQRSAHRCAAHWMLALPGERPPQSGLVDLLQAPLGEHSCVTQRLALSVANSTAVPVVVRGCDLVRVRSLMQQCRRLPRHLTTKQQSTPWRLRCCRPRCRGGGRLRGASATV